MILSESHILRHLALGILQTRFHAQAGTTLLYKVVRTEQKNKQTTHENTAFGKVVDRRGQGILGVAKRPLVNGTDAITVRGRHDNIDHEVTEKRKAFERRLASEGFEVL